jgi:cysteine desulfurase
MDKYTPYLDYMASTPIAPEVLKSMLPFLTSIHGNPNSQHCYGQEASLAIENARAAVAKSINAKTNEIFFTSGATESINLAIKGAAEFYRKSGNHIVTLKTEHAATLESCAYLESKGFEVSYLDVKQNGLLDLDLLKSTLTNKTILVTICHVNNEIGVIQNINEIAKIVKTSGALLHVDAAQALGKIELNMAASNINMMSLSGHKCYGPKGIGALYINSTPKIRLTPILHGGNQELGLRSGTLATHQIVGFGAATELSVKNFTLNNNHVTKIHNLLLQELLSMPNTQLNGCRINRVPHNINITFKDVAGKELFSLLSKDIAIASGSACSSHELAISHVLRTIGLTRDEANATLRLSIGNYTSEEDVLIAIDAIKNSLTILYKG